jgi:thioredoxin reductase (NADPH)
VTQARKFGARTATPYVAVSLEADGERHMVRLDQGNEVSAPAIVLANGAQYRRLPVGGLADYEGISVFYAAGPPEARRCGGSQVAVVGGGNSAGQAAIWLARGGALVTLLHRRADLSETMSDYLIHDLERAGVQVRDRSEIAELHGTDGELEAVTLADGERLPFRDLFLFLGAEPHTDWLGDSVERDEDGFLLTGNAARSDNLLETSIPGVYAIGDARCGSTKRPARLPYRSAQQAGLHFGSTQRRCSRRAATRRCLVSVDARARLSRSATPGFSGRTSRSRSTTPENILSGSS